MQKQLIKNNLRKVRLEKKITLKEVAEYLGTSASNIRHVESRPIENTTLFKYISLMMRIGVDIEQILTDGKQQSE